MKQKPTGRRRHRAHKLWRGGIVYVLQVEMQGDTRDLSGMYENITTWWIDAEAHHLESKGE